MVEATILLTARYGVAGSERLQALLGEANVRTVASDDALMRIAIDAYHRYGRGSDHRARPNLGDCFSNALAEPLDARLLHNGDDFVHTDIRSAIP